MIVPVAVEAVMTGVGGLMVNVTVKRPVPVASVAPTVAVNVPKAVGVPVIAPVVVLIINPAGKPVAVKLVGELLAATV